ncbi:MAG: hypothetical protein K9L72_04040 [Candidatus Omnitrophica bacterium]|nr:hypothetical protein [Candidatus Omnitrophota bacterium]MCF7892214.1 hypothetical protein [Candidatus Omnitrophota bacterium]MCF7896151.1 hypothetical protein [Candidatus Omnitrophota bacterium]
MEREKEIIKKYLKEKLNTGATKKSNNCPENQTLIDYLQNNLSEEKRKSLETHIACCSFCLSQISIASEAFQKHKKNSFNPLPENIINQAKTNLNSIKTKTKKDEFQKKAIKRRFFLATTIIFFILSFIVPKYFLQFLVGALILGIRWSFESESGKTLIMILNSWRKHSHDKDDEISNQLKDQLKK